MWRSSCTSCAKRLGRTWRGMWPLRCRVQGPGHCCAAAVANRRSWSCTARSEVKNSEMHPYSGDSGLYCGVHRGIWSQLHSANGRRGMLSLCCTNLCLHLSSPVMQRTGSSTACGACPQAGRDVWGKRACNSLHPKHMMCALSACSECTDKHVRVCHCVLRCAARSWCPRS